MVEIYRKLLYTNNKKNNNRKLKYSMIKGNEYKNRKPLHLINYNCFFNIGEETIKNKILTRIFITKKNP